MYEYKYVGCNGEGFSGARFERHRELIGGYAAEGWRYVGFLPTYVTGHGAIQTVDLIFEREVKEEA